MIQRPPRVVKFLEAEIEEISMERCRARVVLQTQPKVPVVGTATFPGACSELESLRCVAQAAAEALLQAVGAGDDSLTVNEVNLTDTFGKRTFFVGVAACYEGEERDLVGFCVVDDDPTRSAALAVLNATNRFLGVG